MKKTKGYTLIEMIITITIIGILLTLAIPSLIPSIQYDRKSQANTTRRIVVNAIDYWVKDNINPIQRPADFNSVNSQGNTVTDYITNTEVFNKTDKKIEQTTIQGENHKKIVDDTSSKKGDMKLDFEDGILKINYGYRERKNFYYCVLGEENFDQNRKQVKNYHDFLASNRIVQGEQYKEYI